ncbi:MAG TPA: hypothetical protein VFL66_10150 [Gaiellaceae bacterium]|nr:hypothetical protein [Gaiellaceae bacterium]
MRTPVAVLLALLAAVALAGCGSPPHYSLSSTRSCFAKDGVRITEPKGDFVAESATDGTFRVWLHGRHGNFVTISFGDDTADAKNTTDGYLRFHAKNVGISDVLYTEKNVVLLWRQHPTDAELNEVTDCLK